MDSQRKYLDFLGFLFVAVVFVCLFVVVVVVVVVLFKTTKSNLGRLMDLGGRFSLVVTSNYCQLSQCCFLATSVPESLRVMRIQSFLCLEEDTVDSKL